jgi:EmrB/QacA subfamily drug resistance transporter
MNRTQRWTLAAAVLGSSIVFLDATVVNTALPIIGRELSATLVSVLEGQTYVVSGYLATLAALLILAGALADYYGRRRIFAIGLAGFGVTSVLCAIAPNLELLVLFRILQGAAGALLVPGSLAIITATFEGEARGRAIGIWAATSAATGLIGPLVTGVIIGISWRLAFLLNVPLIAIALWATWRYVKESRDESVTGSFDWLGAIVAVIAIGGLSFGPIRGQDRQWRDPVAFIALGVGILAAIAFPILMARRPNPLIPLSLFRSRAFTVINLSTLLIYGALYTSFYFQSLFLQGVLGYSPLAVGIVGLPVGIQLTLLSTRIGAMAARVGSRMFLFVGPLLMTAGVLWWSRIPSSSAAWHADAAAPTSLIPPASVLVDVLPATLLYGLGLSFVVAPLTSTLMGSVPVQRSGLASAINNAISRVGQPIVAAVIFIVVSGTFYAALASEAGVDASSPELRRAVQPLNPPAPGTPEAIATAAHDASTDAFHLAALVSAALLAAGGIVNYVGLRDVRPSDQAASTNAATTAG